jgi:hypothetical protein
MKNLLRILLIVLDGFLALTAIGGGIALLAGLYAPPVEMLAGSPFKSYTVPGLALFVLVGGSALVAMMLLIRRHPMASLASAAAGGIIIIFEIVEVLVIGSPPAVSRNLQIFYFAIGGLIMLLAAANWLVNRSSSPQM